MGFGCAPVGRPPQIPPSLSHSKCPRERQRRQRRRRGVKGGIGGNCCSDKGEPVSASKGLRSRGTLHRRRPRVAKAVQCGPERGSIPRREKECHSYRRDKAVGTRPEGWRQKDGTRRMWASSLLPLRTINQNARKHRQTLRWTNGGEIDLV